MSGVSGDRRGQALVEFSIAITVFLTLLVGTVDLGRAMFMYNGASNAARELARTTSVHPGTGALGSSPESAATLEIQRGLVPGLSTPTFSCFDLAGAAVSGDCQPGDWVRVQVTTTYNAVLPLLALLGPIDLTASSSAQIQ